MLSPAEFTGKVSHVCSRAALPPAVEYVGNCSSPACRQVLRETRATDRRLDSVDQRIRDEAKRSARLKPAEVKQHCEKVRYADT